MTGRTARAFALALLVGVSAQAFSVALSDAAFAVVGAAERAVLDVVVASEGQQGAAAQVAHIMASSLTGPEKALALQWLIEGAATDAQVSDLAKAVIAAAVAASVANQPGLVMILGTGLGQGTKALNSDGRVSAAEAISAAVLEAVSAQGAMGSVSGQMASLFMGSFSSAAAGTSRSVVGVDGDSVDPGETDTPNPPSQS